MIHRMKPLRFLLAFSLIFSILAGQTTAAAEGDISTAAPPTQQINDACNQLIAENIPDSAHLFLAFYHSNGRLSACLEGTLDATNEITPPDEWDHCTVFLLSSNYSPLATREIRNSEEAPSEEETPSEEEDPEPELDGSESGEYDDGTSTPPPSSEETGSTIGNQLVRIGIYYGTAGKDSQELSITQGDGFHFGYYDVDNQFITLSSTTIQAITVRTTEDTMVVTSTADGTELYLHDLSYGLQLGILPYSNDDEKTMTRCGYNYYGGFRFERIAAYDNTMTIVNMVPLDDYIKGVVPYEMSASWHEEALKVQTICARTFALSHLSKHGRTFSFDLCDSNCCQVYKGLYAKSNASNIETAVDSTSGMVLMYDGQYCSTVYSSSNGGASESAKNVWGRDIPYLQGVEDPYEALIADQISNYAWSVSFTSEELQEKLISSGYTSCGLIQEVSTTLSETGNVIVLTFVDEYGKSFSIYNGSKCRTFLSLRSPRYTVSWEDHSESTEEPTPEDETDLASLAQGDAIVNADGSITYIETGLVLTADGIATSTASSAESITFTFSGTGWGHNVGMSQYGAYSMANLGYSYVQILLFYYTGATVVQL